MMRHTTWLCASLVLVLATSCVMKAWHLDANETNLQPEDLEAVKERYCYTEATYTGFSYDSKTPEADPVSCYALLRSAALGNDIAERFAGLDGQPDTLELATLLSESSQQLIDNNLQIWQRGIERSVELSSLRRQHGADVGYDFETALTIAKDTYAQTGCVERLREAEKRIQDVADTEQAVELVVQAKKLVNHALEPSGSKKTYSQRTSEAKETFDEARMRYELASERAK